MVIRGEGSHTMNKISLISIIVSIAILTACAEPAVTVQTHPENNKTSEYVMLGPVENTIQFAHPADVGPSHVRGARFYDNLNIEIGAMAGRNPLIDMANETAEAAAVTDEDSWRCVTCHGYDFEGTFTFFNGTAANLLELVEVRAMDEDYVGTALMNGFDVFNGTVVSNVHNYSSVGNADIQPIVDVADFVANELFDTHVYIKAATNGVAAGFSTAEAKAEGQALYEGVVDMRYANPETATPGGLFSCVSCHGADGMGVANVMLPLEAWNSPWRFLFRTLFGSPRALPSPIDDPTVMPGLYEVTLSDGLHFAGAEQGALIQAYMQSLPPM